MKRHDLLRMVGAFGAVAVLPGVAPAYSRSALPTLSPTANGERLFEFVVDTTSLRIGARTTSALSINGSVPAPLLRAREGETAVIRVTNRLKESTSIHWHGLLVPNAMDGVPGVTFRGIEPGQTFTYRLPIRQSGTYWFHSHSGLQEQIGVYGPIVLDPAEHDPVGFDREYVVMLSDWTFDNPMTLIEKLRKNSGYFNFQKLTVGDSMRIARSEGRDPSLLNRSDWARMRMDPTDLADVGAYAYTYLMNGQTPEANWTPLFRPGESVRLRVIGGAAMTTFDVRIPGLAMTVVQADGQHVKPIVVDEFRVAPGETYDVIVRPTDDRAYTIFAETMDRSGYARGTLAPRIGMSAAIPTRRPRALLSMNDMGMTMSAGDSMAGISMGAATQPPSPGDAMAGMDMRPTASPTPTQTPSPTPKAKPKPKPMAGMTMNGGSMAGMDMRTPKPAASPTMMPQPEPTAHVNGAYLPGSPPVMHGADSHGVENSMVPMQETNRLAEPGSGLEHAGHRVLVYTDLKSLAPQKDRRDPVKTLELHVTGNMERYMWSFDGKKYSEAGAYVFRRGERVRMILVNDTMMEHPVHLHGMYMELENGATGDQPLKHTIRVKPAERLSVAITPDELGDWALHCHLLLHMELGMMRVVRVVA